MWKNVDATEKKVLIIASLVSAGHLFLVAYAAIFLQISVPTCQPNEKLFDKAELRTVGEQRFEVHYLAKMWNFEPKKLVIPVGSTVDFFLGSKDVNHGFHINNTNINLMAVPGVINKGTHTFKVPGIYHIVCHEYCGLGHQNMNAEIEVSDKVQTASIDPDSSAAAAASGLPAELSAMAHEGRELYQKKGCVGCHSLDGTTGAGPSFKGLWGKTEELVDGSKILVDDAYIAESIKEPAAKVAKGFGPIMPKLGLTDEEIKNVTEFIKTAK
jgi:cytochrome c oxidase subunit 2